MLRAFSIGPCGPLAQAVLPCPGAKAGEFLARYASRFNLVEVDYSCYRLPSATSVLRRRDSAPNGFVFSLTASGSVTHCWSLHGVASQPQAF